jgi:phospholipase/carboxylesterase
MLRPASPRALLSLTFACALACDARTLPQAEAGPPRPLPARPVAAAPPTATPAVTPAVTTSRYLSAAGMEYLEVIHVPPGTPEAQRPAADARLPMLIAIHGLGDSPENFQDLIVDLPTTARVIVPRGLDPVDGGYSWFPIRARSQDVAGLSQGIATAADRLAALIEELQRSRPTIGHPVVTGFSQGGMLSFTLAVYHPELLAVAVPVGGWLPPPLWPSTLPTQRPLPKIVALHGEADTAVKFLPTREAVEHLEKLGWSISLRAYPEVGHAIPPKMRSELYLQLQRALDAQQ